jgi:hypothetical protein
LDFLVKNP